MRAYRLFINELHTQFGRACWAQIYQAHVRVCREFILRIKRDCVETLKKVAELEAVGKRFYGIIDPNNFDPKRPWNRSFQLCIGPMYSAQLWEKNVRTPCFQIQARIAYANTFLDGDVCIAVENEYHYATGCVPQVTSGIYDQAAAQRVPPVLKGPGKVKQ